MNSEWIKLQLSTCLACFLKRDEFSCEMQYGVIYVQSVEFKGRSDYKDMHIIFTLWSTQVNINKIRICLYARRVNLDMKRVKNI